MDLGLLFVLLGIGALFAFGDFFSSSNSDSEPPDEDEENERRGTEGNDLMISTGGEILMGLEGDDTLITYGDSTLMGGEGDDTLVSVGGGAVLNGGEGADTFVINLLELSDEGDLLDINGAPVSPTVIDDFNPDEDRLVLDLRLSGLLPEDGEPVLLTGVAAPDGEGLMIQINGVNVVQLSSYGGGDMQSALEDLVNLDGAIEIIGADFVFPPDGLGTPDGVEIIENPNGSLSFVITDDYSGGGELVGAAGVADILDLTQFSGNASIIEDDEGNIYLHIEGNDTEPTLLTNVTSVILGSGENVVNVGSVPGGFTVTATDGTNTISAWRGGLDVLLLGGTNTVEMSDYGTLRVTIGGGDNTINADDDVVIAFNIGESATGTTVISGGLPGSSLAFLGDGTGTTVTLTESGGVLATWDGGSVEMDTAGFITVGAGTLVDATARDVEATAIIRATGPGATVIGGDNPVIMIGQGDFSGGDGDDQITIFNFTEGGATADGGAGDDILIADISDGNAGDLVMTGGEGTDSFVVQIDMLRWEGTGGVARITDLEDGETVRIDITTYQFSPTPVPSPEITVESDPEANEVRVLVNGELALVIENRFLIEPGLLEANVTVIRDFDDGVAA